MAVRKAVIYMKHADPYGVRAKALLRAKGVAVSVHDLPAGERETYIVIGSWRGTFEELGSLDLKGELDALFG